MNELDDRTPPQDMAAEQCVIGTCMNLGRIPESADLLSGADFYRPAHETIWEAMRSLVKSGKPCDLYAI